MVVTDPTSVVAALRSALAGAMAQRDRSAMAVYRAAIAAIDNAAAVPLTDEHQASAVESSAAAGRTEAERRLLTRDEEITILKQEIRDRRAAADSLAVARPETARKLHAEADLLQTLLDDLMGEPG